MSIEFYSQRLLNPFRGVMNVIRYRGAEAVTTDGVHWEIYVSNDELRNGLDPHAHVQISDIRYGHWSAQAGLKRGPIYPSQDFKRMEALGAVVYDALLQGHDRLPFPLCDRYELWLLDQAQQPLCLLHSEVNEYDISLDVSLDWRAGNLCAETFRPQLGEPTQAATLLNDKINALTSAPASACWFQRTEDNSAVALHPINLTDMAMAQFSADQFPRFFIREQHADPDLTALVQAFVRWQAPWLLLLQDLTPALRHELEQHARKQALLVEQHFRLYPEIQDASFLRAARVEAMLRKTQARANPADGAMSTWYLELGDWSRGK